MKNSAIVAPIHAIKFNYGVEFVKSYNTFNENDADLSLVFSNEKERKSFSNIIDSNLKYNSIIWIENIEYSKPITQKKLFGVKNVFDNNPQIQIVATVDVDSIFIKKFDYDCAFKNSLERKTLYATKSDDAKTIMSKNAEFFSKEDKAKIIEKTENFSLYFWFNDIPLYDRCEFYNFLNYINYDTIKNKITYQHFDYMLYAYYLLIHDKIEIKKLNVSANFTKNESFLEKQTSFSSEEFIKTFTAYNPMWIKNLIKDEYMPNVFMQIHKDRK